ncbi:NAD(P)/FAD-dependent oxidoreductase [Gynuella sunshinyii]|uniref:Putative flavoprotein n=1 Tax=Gynuella sunshinyii YC6258 TaxID=1445510 RepID=A0A0C5VHG9_9GAMM|nr:TIGR03862 family flavoprotein [Gynuella sunshinyii]AJQ93701.1 putative flavoprotein [Gynuella sunshinyii YC6258]
MNKKVIVIGAGPAGLMAAEQLAGNGVTVDIYDAMPSVARKFLRAGIGGLNITHSEPLPQFIARYHDSDGRVASWLYRFGPQELRQWCAGLGIETFVGSSGRVFPTQKKAAPLLRRWLSRLRQAGVTFHLRHQWQGWQADGQLRLFDRREQQPVLVSADAVILAMGGGSWKKLGSDGQWQAALTEREVAIAPLQPSNCGFNLSWTDYMRQFAGQALKSVALSVDGRHFKKGEMVLSHYGLEGSLVYAMSRSIRECLQVGESHVWVDLLPDLSEDKIRDRLSKPRGKESMSSYLRKRLNISGVKYALLRECSGPDCDLNRQDDLINAIKRLQLRVDSPRPVDEAISTAGGIKFSELDEQLMLKRLPGVFVAGEMLDWDAPTGGYLLTACFASGYLAGQGVRQWLALV